MNFPTFFSYFIFAKKINMKLLQKLYFCDFPFKTFRKKLLQYLACMNPTRELPPQYLQNCPIIDERYKILFKLGSGRFSKVRMAICLASNQRVAIKIMNQREPEDTKIKQYNSNMLRSFINEVTMCVKSHHKNIIKIIDFQVGGIYRSPDGRVRRIMYYVMKIASNGELFRLIKQTDMFHEKFARFLFHQLISAVEHLHSSRIAHRDIKPQNILIDQKLNIRLADFGCSNYFIDHEHNKIKFDPSVPVGTLKSNAPEITNAEKEDIYHGDELDLFACGYVLFQMVMKAQPFKSSDHKDAHYSKLMQEDKNNFWKIFAVNCDPSPDFKNLIQSLFDANPKTRICLQSLKQHPWYMKQIPTKKQYKKQMNSRLKKVWSKVRKQQQQEIKAFFKQERSKIQCGKPQDLHIPRDFEDQIFHLRQLIKLHDNSDSSSCASNADAKDLIIAQNEVKKMSLQRNQ